MAASAPPPILLWDPAAPFCPRCGSLLVLPDAGDVACDACPFSRPIASFPHPVTRTASFPKPTPEWLVEWAVLERAQRGEIKDAEVGAAVMRAGGKAANKRAVVKEKCPNPQCDAETMEWYTAQLRSADEGQTVFYNCAKCGHAFSVNT
jgi:DNA-directed RNA polymerase I subunit RPA12